VSNRVKQRRAWQGVFVRLGLPASLALIYLFVFLVGAIAIDNLAGSLGLGVGNDNAADLFKESVFACLTCLVLYELSRRLLRRVEEGHLNVVKSNRELVRKLATAAEFRDDETGFHNHRISEYARLVGARMGLSPDECDLLFHGAALHDVGKIAIPDDILRKAGPLTSEEREVMQAHVLLGAEILADSISPEIEVAQTIALSHHENWDGSGYPYGLRGPQIPLEGRIVSVCDVFDALASLRPYKDAWLPHAALEEIRRLSGTKFDPHVVEAFADIFDQICSAKGRMTNTSERLANRIQPLRVVSNQDMGCRTCHGDRCTTCYYRLDLAAANRKAPPIRRAA